MKKLLLAMMMASFVLACATATPTATNPYADMTSELAKYTDACSDVAFADARSSMNQVNELFTSGKTKEAADLFASTAQGQRDKAVADYTDYKNRNDKANATMQNQQSRVNALPNNAEVTAMKAKVDAAHATATTALTTCDLAAAETALADAEAQLAALEAKYGRPSGDTYTVVRGDSLWKIAAKRYANPYFWPLIYWANNSAIKDPDLIYPNQQFKIETGTASQQADAEKLARTRGAWSLFDGK